MQDSSYYAHLVIDTYSYIIISLSPNSLPIFLQSVVGEKEGRKHLRHLVDSLFFLS